MEMSDVTESLEQSGIKAIIALRPPEDENNNDVILESNIQSFVNCLEAFSINVAFVYAETFGKEHFELEEEEDFEAESEISGYDEDEYIDIVKIEPKLKTYKEHIGKHCSYELFAQLGNRMIRAIISEQWWDEFSAIKEEAIDKLDGIEEEREEEEKKREQELINDLLKQLNALSRDSEFCEFTSKAKQTQNAILTYAVELIPELDNLDRKFLKSKVGELADRIRVRKKLKNKNA